ncbi:MAG: hypothetical protein J6S80_03745 [Alphaproteobacteria bacterium]|nr:hypothetical protein [Alphaproteobacteria bacterium]
MAYVETRQNFILSAVGCTLPDSILINFGVSEYIFLTSQSGNFSSTNRVTCTIYHKNGTQENKTVSNNGTTAYFQYGSGTNDSIDDIIFLWGYGAFLPPVYPTVTNNIVFPTGVTMLLSTGITADGKFYIMGTPRRGTQNATDVTFKNVSAEYNNGVITEYPEIKSYTNGLKRVFATLLNYDTQYDTILRGLCGKSVTVASLPQNATFNTPSNVIDTETLNLTATANNGYYFQTAPTAVLYSSGTEIATVQFTLNAADTTATIATLLLNLANYSNVTHVDFVIEAIQQPAPTFVFINNVENATLVTSVNNNEVTATLTAQNSKWAFSTAPTVTYFVNGVETTAALTVAESGQNVVSASLTFTADIGTVQFDGVLSRRVLIDDYSTHTIINGLTTNYLFLNETYNLQFVAANDYCYEVAPKLTVWITGYGSEDLTATLDNNDPHLSANLTVNLAQIYGDDVTDITAIDIIANGVPITAYNYGAINVYKVNTTILNSFAAKRYFTENNFAHDLGDYVITLKRLYFAVGLTVSDVIKCANFNTQIAATTPVKDTVNIDCGTVAIPQYNYNITDFAAEITAFLPFVGFVNISNDYVGKTVNLTYICSAVTGKGFAKLSYDGIVFNTFTCDVSDNLIFKAITDNAAINQLEFNKYNGLQPYIIVKHFDDLTEQIFNNDNKRGLLSTFSGFVKCVEIDGLTAVLPSEIRNEITKQLENGVYL